MTDAFNNEKNLLEALKSSNRKRRDQAYVYLMKTHGRRLKELLMRRGASPVEADDLLQEAFIKVFRAIPQFKGDSSFWTWLRRIAVNVWIDWLRRRKSRPGDIPMRKPDVEDGQPLIDTIESPEPEPSEAAALAQFEECVEQAFAEFERLHPSYAAAVWAEVNADPAAAFAPAASKSGSERQRLYEARASLDLFTRHCRPSDDHS